MLPHRNNGGKSEDPTPHVKAQRHDCDVHDARAGQMFLLLLSRESRGHSGAGTQSFLPRRRAATLGRGSGERAPVAQLDSTSVSVRGSTGGVCAAAAIGGPVDREDSPHVSRSCAHRSRRGGFARWRRDPVGAGGGIG